MLYTKLGGWAFEMKDVVMPLHLQVPCHKEKRLAVKKGKKSYTFEHLGVKNNTLVEEEERVDQFQFYRYARKKTIVFFVIYELCKSVKLIKRGNLIYYFAVFIFALIAYKLLSLSVKSQTMKASRRVVFPLQEVLKVSNA